MSCPAMDMTVPQTRGTTLPETPHTHAYGCMEVHKCITEINVYAHIYMYVCILMLCLYAHKQVCTYANMLCVYMYIYTYLPTHVHI